jgi:hypothetical protein
MNWNMIAGFGLKAISGASSRNLEAQGHSL